MLPSSATPADGVDFVRVGLDITGWLLSLGEVSGLPMLGSVCSAARDILGILRSAKTCLADVRLLLELRH